MTQERTIVYYTEQHTCMRQNVVVHINENTLKEMLIEELTPSSIREFIQALYILFLKSELTISEKTDYGAWNASIAPIDTSYLYMPNMIHRLKGHVTVEDIKNQIFFINDCILVLSSDEKEKSLPIQAELIEYITKYDSSKDRYYQHK